MDGFLRETEIKQRWWNGLDQAMVQGMYRRTFLSHIGRRFKGSTKHQMLFEARQAPIHKCLVVLGSFGLSFWTDIISINKHSIYNKLKTKYFIIITQFTLVGYAMLQAYHFIIIFVNSLLREFSDFSQYFQARVQNFGKKEGRTEFMDGNAHDNNYDIEKGAIAHFNPGSFPYFSWAI